MNPENSGTGTGRGGTETRGTGKRDRATRGTETRGAGPVRGPVRGIFPAAALLSVVLTACAGTTPVPGSEAGIRDAAARSNVTALSVTARSDGGLNVTGLLRVDGLNTVGMANRVPFAARFPAGWNGGSVLFAHGYVQPQQQELVPDPAKDASGGLLSAAYAEGYATADTAYSRVGYAVKEGVAANKSLHDFMARVGGKNIYMTGGSMGGNITVAMAEKYPNDFVGALPYCGVVNGWAAEERWLLDFRVVYDYYTKPLGAPYAVPGAGAALVPRADYTVDSIVQSVGALFSAAGKGDAKAAAIIGQVSRVTGVPADPISYITPLAGLSYGLADLLAVQGGNAVSNAATVYSGSSDDVALNAGVQRLTANPAAVAYVAASYTPSGTFRVPMLSIHNTSDPLVPYRFEPEFRSVVAAAGNGANLVQQTVQPKPVNLADLQNSGPAHCYFSPAELGAAWNELRTWVENGVKPTDGKDITNK